jgi:hypothetical protein
VIDETTNAKHRKLRIAWSVAWGLLAVLLVALWVRSCWTIDNVRMPLRASWTLYFGSSSGEFAVRVRTQVPYTFIWRTYDVDAVHQSTRPEVIKFYTKVLGRFSYVYDAGPALVAPDWFLIGVALALSSAPSFRMPKRFSLRTLLVATTLIAVGLGAIVWRAK